MDLKAFLPEFKKTVHIKNIFGFTENIKTEILEAFNEDKLQCKLIAPFFLGNSVFETCKNIFDYLKKNVQYVEDGKSQNIKSPTALINTGFGDCKSFAIFSASVLYNLGLNFEFCFTGYKPKIKKPTHVYIKCEGIVLDATVDFFNFEYKPFYIDKTMITSQINKIGSLMPIDTSNIWKNFDVNQPKPSGGFDWLNLADTVLQIIPNFIPNAQTQQQQLQNQNVLAQIQANQQAINQLAQTQQQTQGGSMQKWLIWAVLAFVVWKFFINKNGKK